MLPSRPSSHLEDVTFCSARPLARVALRRTKTRVEYVVMDSAGYSARIHIHTRPGDALANLSLLQSRPPHEASPFSSVAHPIMARRSEPLTWL